MLGKSILIPYCLLNENYIFMKGIKKKMYKIKDSCLKAEKNDKSLRNNSFRMNTAALCGVFSAM